MRYDKLGTRSWLYIRARYSCCCDHAGALAVSPLAVPLCALQLIFAAAMHPDRELTNLEAWTIVGRCAGMPAAAVELWFKLHPEWAMPGLRCDWECRDLMKLGLSETEIKSYGNHR